MYRASFQIGFHDLKAFLDFPKPPIFLDDFSLQQLDFAADQHIVTVKFLVSSISFLVVLQKRLDLFNLFGFLVDMVQLQIFLQTKRLEALYLKGFSKNMFSFFFELSSFVFLPVVIILGPEAEDLFMQLHLFSRFILHFPVPEEGFYLEGSGFVVFIAIAALDEIGQVLSAVT